MGSTASQEAAAREAGGPEAVHDPVHGAWGLADGEDPVEELQRLVRSARLSDARASRLGKSEALARAYKLVRRCGGQALDVLCKGSRAAEAAGFLAGLIALQEGDEPELQLASCKVLWLLLADCKEDWSSEMFAPFGLQRLARSRAKMVTSLDNFLLDKGGYPSKLLPLVLSSDREVQKYATACLSLVLARNDPRFLFQGETILDTLVEALVNNVVSTDDDSQLVAASALGSLVSDLATHEVVVNCGGLEHLASLLRRSETSVSVVSAAALCLRLLVQRSPFLCYKALEGKLGDGQRIVLALQGQVFAYFRDFPAHCHRVSASAIMDLVKVITVCTRSDALLALMSGPVAGSSISTVALAAFRGVRQNMAKNTKYASMRRVVAQLLLHLAMVPSYLSVIVAEGGLEATLYVSRFACEPDGSAYMDLHSSENEVLQRRSRHAMYAGRVLAALADFVVEQDDRKAGVVDLAAIVHQVVLDSLWSTLTRNRWFSTVQDSGPTETKALSLNYTALEAALKALGTLLLREQWADAVLRFREPLLPALLGVAGAARRRCVFYNSVDSVVLADVEDQLIHAGHAAAALHLTVRVLSNLSMYPTLLERSEQARALLFEMWRFFSAATSEDAPSFHVPEHFLLATNPDLPRPHEAFGKNPRGNLALQAAFVEACLGKAVLQMALEQRLFDTYQQASSGRATAATPSALGPSKSFHDLLDAAAKSIMPSTASPARDPRQGSRVSAEEQAVLWVQYALDVLDTYEDAHVVSKAMALIAQSLRRFGWATLWELRRRSAPQDGPGEGDPARARSSSVAQEWAWDEAFFERLLGVIGARLDAESNSCRHAAVIREGTRAMLFLTCPERLERRGGLALRLKFDEPDCLASESAGLFLDDRNEPAGASFAVCKGSPVHPVDLAGDNSPVISHTKCPWGVLFRSRKDAIAVGGFCEGPRGTLAEGLALSERGWTISCWLRNVARAETENSGDPEEARLHTLVCAANGDQPVALLQTAVGLELGCLEAPRSDDDRESGLAGLLSAGPAGGPTGSDTWHGSGTAIDRLEPGWHHIVAHCDGKRTSFLVDGSIGEGPVNYATKGSRVALVGNSLARTTPFNPYWVVADLRFYAKPIPLSALVLSPARLPFNRRPWESGNKWSLAHEIGRHMVGARVFPTLAALLAIRSAEVQLVAARLLLNLVSQRANVSRFIASGAMRTVLEHAHISVHADAAQTRPSGPLPAGAGHEIEADRIFLQQKRAVLRATLQYALLRVQ